MTDVKRRRDRNEIEAQLETGKARMAPDKMTRRPLDPPAHERTGGGKCVLDRGATLDLDKSERPAPARHQVDLPDRRLVTPRHDPVPLEPQQQRREIFREQAGGVTGWRAFQDFSFASVNASS